MNLASFHILIIVYSSINILRSVGLSLINFDVHNGTTTSPSAAPAPKYSRIVRTDFCGRAAALANASISLPQALAGMKVVVGIPIKGLNPLFMIANTTGKAIGDFVVPSGGYNYNVQQTLQNLAGFEFVFKIIPASTSFKSSTAYLAAMTQQVDFVAHTWYSDNPFRRSIGLQFTDAIVDASLTLVTLQGDSVVTVSIFNFFAPFTIELWWLIIGTIAVNGCVRFWMEFKGWNVRTRFGDEKLMPFSTFVQYLYQSFASFTFGEDSMKGDDRFLSSVMAGGMSFLMLVVTASYVANLAAILSTQSTPTYLVSSMHDANTRKATLCYQAGFASGAVAKQHYPGIELVAVAGSGLDAIFNPIDAMRQGQCVGVILNQGEGGSSSVAFQCSMCNV